jgi:uncharacterized repeat protein (TIGR01451 family)
MRTIPMTCSLGTIAAGGHVVITVVARPTRPGCRTRNAASATGDGADAAPATNLDTVDICVRSVALRLTKRANRSTAAAGGLITYTIRVANPTRGTARDVQTCDRLPAGLVYVRSRSRAKLAAGGYCWTATQLGARTSRTYHLTARVLRGANGNIINRATVSGAQARTAQARARIHVLDTQARGGGVTG